MARTIVPLAWQRWLKRLLQGEQLDEVAMVFEAINGVTESKLMIDVGAHHGSSCRPFVENGWNVCAFEPDEENRKIFTRAYKGRETVILDPRAVSNENNLHRPFFISDVSSGISGLSAFHDSHTLAYHVETVTLDTFFRTNSITAVGFLKIDTEGFDLFVLQGVPWSRVSPEVVVCEFEDAKTIPLGYTFNDLATFLVDLDYHLIVSEWHPVVEYGRRHQWRRFTAFPCELMDPNAWGNIIALKDQDLHASLLAAECMQFKQRAA